MSPDASYEAFLDCCLRACSCDDSYRPCAGVMAGGVCDDMQTGDGPEAFPYDDDDDEEDL